MVKMKKRSKKLIKLYEDGMESSDRISNLPDSLISKILSLLPTENAVATSILSRRWKFLWTSITTLNFIEMYPKMRVNMKKAKFTVFVNRVIMLITPPCIHKFRLHSTHTLFDPIHLQMWMSVIAQTVREFDLRLNLNGNLFELQMNHFRFSKLVILELRGNINLTIPSQASLCFPNLQKLYLSHMAFSIAMKSSVSFPNLQKLYLSQMRFSIAMDSSVSFPNLMILHFCFVIYENEESIRKLLSSCPVVLQELYVWMNSSASVMDFKIAAKTFVCYPHLQQLDLRYITFYFADDSSISFPNLKILCLSFVGCVNGESVQNLISRCPTLHDLHIDIRQCKNLSRLLICSPSLTKLKLISLSSVPGFKIQIDSPHKLQFLSIPFSAFKVIENEFSNFCNLKRLDLDVGDCSKLSFVIDNMLECMDNLEYLAIKMGPDYCFCANIPWSQPLNVPKGLACCVTTISFKTSISLDQISNDCHHQLEFLRYVLKSAGVLQVLELIIHSIDSDKKRELLEKISEFAKGSQACQIKFM